MSSRFPELDTARSADGVTRPLRLNGAEILEQIRHRLAVLAPYVEEYARLERADKALGGVPKTNGRVPEPELTPPTQLAPYGYRADGKPRKRRPPADPNYARKGWETRRASAA